MGASLAQAKDGWRLENEGERQEVQVEGSRQVGSQTLPGPQAVVSIQIFSWDFPGGPVAKTPCSRCTGPRFDSWFGNQVPRAATNRSHTPQLRSRAAKYMQINITALFPWQVGVVSECLDLPSPWSLSPGSGGLAENLWRFSLFLRLLRLAEVQAEARDVSLD